MTVGITLRIREAPKVRVGDKEREPCGQLIRWVEGRKMFTKY